MVVTIMSLMASIWWHEIVSC